MEFVVTKWQNIFKGIVELNDVFTLVLEWARMQGQIWFNVWKLQAYIQLLLSKGIM